MANMIKILQLSFKIRKPIELMDNLIESNIGRLHTTVRILLRQFSEILDCWLDMP